MVKNHTIKNIPPNTQITIYETDDGRARVEVRFEDENVWLTQKLMAELFEVAVSTINEHLGNIFSTGELSKKTVIRNFRITAADRKSYLAKHYSLEAIIAVGYRVNSQRGTTFRQWATERLKEYMIKAELEFSSYKKVQDKNYISDFDRLTKKLLKKAKI